MEEEIEGGRITRAFRKRLNSLNIDNEGSSRPGTPVTAMKSSTDNVANKTPVRRSTRRRSISEDEAIRTPSKMTRKQKFDVLLEEDDIEVKNIDYTVEAKKVEKTEKKTNNTEQSLINDDHIKYDKVTDSKIESSKISGNSTNASSDVDQTPKKALSKSLQEQKSKSVEDGDSSVKEVSTLDISENEGKVKFNENLLSPKQSTSSEAFDSLTKRAAGTVHEGSGQTPRIKYPTTPYITKTRSALVDDPTSKDLVLGLEVGQLLGMGENKKNDGNENLKISKSNKDEVLFTPKSKEKNTKEITDDNALLLAEVLNKSKSNQNENESSPKSKISEKAANIYINTRRSEERAEEETRLLRSGKLYRSPIPVTPSSMKDKVLEETNSKALYPQSWNKSVSVKIKKISMKIDSIESEDESNDTTDMEIDIPSNDEEFISEKKAENQKSVEHNKREDSSASEKENEDEEEEEEEEEEGGEDKFEDCLFVDSKAREASEEYQSGDSVTSHERQEMAENIPEEGESLGSKDTDESISSEETNYGSESFIDTGEEFEDESNAPEEKKKYKRVACFSSEDDTMDDVKTSEEKKTAANTSRNEEHAKKDDNIAENHDNDEKKETETGELNRSEKNDTTAVRNGTLYDLLNTDSVDTVIVHTKSQFSDNSSNASGIDRSSSKLRVVTSSEDEDAEIDRKVDFLESLKVQNDDYDLSESDYDLPVDNEPRKDVKDGTDQNANNSKIDDEALLTAAKRVKKALNIQSNSARKSLGGPEQEKKNAEKVPKRKSINIPQPKVDLSASFSEKLEELLKQKRNEVNKTCSSDVNEDKERSLLKDKDENSISELRTPKKKLTEPEGELPKKNTKRKYSSIREGDDDEIEFELRTNKRYKEHHENEEMPNLQKSNEKKDDSDNDENIQDTDMLLNRSNPIKRTVIAMHKKVVEQAVNSENNNAMDVSSYENASEEDVAKDTGVKSLEKKQSKVDGTIETTVENISKDVKKIKEVVADAIEASVQIITKKDTKTKPKPEKKEVDKTSAFAKAVKHSLNVISKQSKKELQKRKQVLKPKQESFSNEKESQISEKKKDHANDSHLLEYKRLPQSFLDTVESKPPAEKRKKVKNAPDAVSSRPIKDKTTQNDEYKEMFSVGARKTLSEINLPQNKSIKKSDVRKFKTAAGEIVECPASPTKKMSTSAGTFVVEPMSPKQENNRGFRESPIPSRTSFKVRQLVKDDNDIPLALKSRKRKRGFREIKEPKQVLPSSPWPKESRIVVEERPSVPVARAGGTEFLVSTLKKQAKLKQKSSGRDILNTTGSSSSKATDFKHAALFGKKIPRENAQSVFHRKVGIFTHKKF